MDFGNNHPGALSTTWPNVFHYKVFLSFRGGDVRRGFIQFLYRGLVDSGIDTFIDYEGINIGEEIMVKILQVIRHTEICIPVFSKDFASSKSCLKEVAEMVEYNRTIMPIFYDVSPSVVGNQDGSYEKSFCTHAAQGVMSATIDTWKKALQTVSRARGWKLETFTCGEPELTDEVVSTVRQLLREDDLYVTAHLVGMDHPVQDVMKKLDVRYENGKVIEGQMLTGKRVVVISGLPGSGTSTLAKVVYNKIHHLFEVKRFLEDIQREVKEGRLQSLQEYLIGDLKKKGYKLESSQQCAKFIKHKFSDLKVLIMLDGVIDSEQINSLAVDLSWFGLGSRIIVISTTSNLVDKLCRVPVTSTSSSTVNSCDDFIVEKYELDEMEGEHAFQLFCDYALGESPPQEEFSSLAREISLAIGGLPSIIRVVGSSLFGQSTKFWKEALRRLKRKTYDEKIKLILGRRYEDIDNDAKEIFLDIACFFVGEDKAIPFYMWEACEFDPYRGMKQLHNMSLVKIRENNVVWMHNQLQVFGWEFVKGKKPSEPSEWSRLWDPENIELILKEKTVAVAEALSATFDKSRSFMEHKFFGYFSKLRYLRIDNAIIEGCEQREDLFLPRLKWLEWQRCHNISTLLALDLSNLVILDLSWSKSMSWQCWGQIMEKAKNLKVLILKGCPFLAESLVFHASVNLERLNLEHCLTLPGVDRSISELTNLVSLNIKFCSFVRALPKDMSYLKALKELYIDGTSIEAIDFPEGSYGKLEILSACKCEILSLPDSIDNLKSLLYLALDETKLRKLPKSIGLLRNLHTLSLRNCRSLWDLPDSIGSLEGLKVMDLSDGLIDKLPSSVKDLRNLKVLKMPGTFLREFPGGIKNLERLEEIDFSGCRSLMGECDITGLSSLRVLLLENTAYSQVIGTDVQCSNFPSLRLRISKDGTTKEAQHRLHGCEATTQFQADGSMQMIS